MLEPKRVGAPSKYKPEFNDEFLDLSRQGYSILAIAGHFEVSKDTVYQWAKVHPEFSDSIKRHKAMRTFSWETRLIHAKDGYQVTKCIWGLKNAAPDEWRDRIDQNTASDQTIRQVSVSMNVTAKEAAELYHQMIKGSK